MELSMSWFDGRPKTGFRPQTLSTFDVILGSP